MLRSTHSLIHFDFSRMTARPDRLRRRRDHEYLAAAEECLSVYRLGSSLIRQELHQQVTTILGCIPTCPPRRISAFCKLLDDASRFNTGKDSAKLRKKVFAAAAGFHPVVQTSEGLFDNEIAKVRQVVSDRCGLDWSEIETTLFADVIELQTLQGIDQKLTAGQLLAQYNLAQTQAALYRATSVRINLTKDFQTIVSAIKLAGLMHRIERAGQAPPRYRVQLDGPQSALRRTSRYGVRFAQLLASLVRCDGWSMEARLLGPGDQPFRLLVKSSDGLTSPKPAPEAFDSKMEQEIFDAWERNPIEGWTFTRETDLLCIGQTVFTPDYTLRHVRSGRVIFVELVGFWSPEYLTEKQQRLEQFTKHPDHQHHRWLLIFPKTGKPSDRVRFRDLDLPHVLWKKRSKPQEWVEAIQHHVNQVQS